jgi:hypothetical protein
VLFLISVVCYYVVFTLLLRYYVVRPKTELLPARADALVLILLLPLVLTVPLLVLLLVRVLVLLLLY